MAARSYWMRSARLGFGEWTPDDSALALALWGDPRVTRLIGGPFSAAQIRDRLAREITHRAAHGIQYWPVFRLADDAHVGCCGLRPFPEQEGVREMGFHLRPEHWGQGYATEAGQAVLRCAFTALGLRGLVAGHHPHNDASRAVLRKLGFRYRHDVFYEPTGLEHPSYALTAEDYARSLTEEAADAQEIAAGLGRRVERDARVAHGL
jgi:RimJ/RimL family protein N-acetyltransferase